MNKKSIILIITLIIIITSIFFIESTKTKYYGEDIEVVELSRLPEQKNLTTEVIEQPLEEQPLTQEIIERIKEKERKYSKAIELVSPDGYINTDEITIADLIGEKVILIDFWTYSCINCQRTLPYLTSWYEKYKDKGFVIIGVHTPEFEFEKDYNNVKKAAEKWNVNYPVVQDNNYYTWRAYKNRYWPRKYLIDIDGFIVFDHIGEGAYEKTEMLIQELLKEKGETVVEDITQSTEDIRVMPRTPELYAGYEFMLPRGQNIGNPEGLRSDKTIDYVLPESIRSNVIYLEGEWKSNSENLHAQDNEESSIILNFMGKSVNIVADSLTTPIKLEVFIDNKYISQDQAGADVQFENGKAFIIIDNPGLYNIVDGDYNKDTLKLTTTSKEFIFNAFTFG